MSIYLGIDPGYADMGFGVVEKAGRREGGKAGKDYCLCYGSIQTDKTLSSAERLKQIYDGLADVIERYKPERAAVEKLYFSKNAKTALQVAEARGVILLCLQKMKIPFDEMDPVQVKTAVCGYGRASKPEMQKMVRILLNLKDTPKPDDAADALALAIALSNSKLLSL